MRQKSNKNFNIVTETISISDKTILRAEIYKTPILDNTTIFACQAGFGKTTYIINRIEERMKKEIEENKIIEEYNKDKTESEHKKYKHTRFAVYAKNHKLLREEYLPRLEKYGAVHVKGVTYVDPKTKECMCPDPKMVEMHDYFRSIKIVCGKICKKDKEEKADCPYFKQNKKAQIILAPIELLKGNIDNRDEVIVDENIVSVSKVEKAYLVSKMMDSKFYKALKEDNGNWMKYNKYKLLSLKSKLLEKNIEEEVMLELRKLYDMTSKRYSYTDLFYIIREEKKLSILEYNKQLQKTSRDMLAESLRLEEENAKVRAKKLKELDEI